MSNAFAGFLANRREAILQVLLIAGSLIALTYTANQFLWRADLTANNRYTLASASTEIAQNLADPVTVTAYFSENLPARFGRAREEFRALLEEFRAASDGNVEFKFVDPTADDETEKEAQQAGVQPVTIDVRQQNQMTQKRAYLGAVFEYQGNTEVVPFVEPGASAEYVIASTMATLTQEQKPVLGVLQGHGEPSLQAIQQVRQALEGRYNFQTVSGVDSTGVPSNVDVLLVAKPTSALSTQAALAVDQYVMRGGRVLFALNRSRENMRIGRASPLSTGLEPLLSSYGLPVRADLVRDQNASTVQVQQQRGGLTTINQIRYPYIPQIRTFSDHPITQGLEQGVFQFVSSLDTTAVDTTAELTVLARSSRRSGSADIPTSIRPQQEWSPSDFTASYLPVAGLLQGSFSSPFADNDTLSVDRAQSADTRIIVVGDGDFLVNGQGQQQRRLPEDNINFVANSIDYLADETGLISIRGKQVTGRPLMQIGQTTQTILKYLNVLLPIVLAIGYGLFRYRRNQARREQRRREGLGA